MSSSNHKTEQAPGDNSPEMRVSELANALKRTVEENYAFVRVRGELGRVVLAKSGHLYFDIKDEGATLNTIMWKGNAAKPAVQARGGAWRWSAEGRLSTYPGRSNYQLIADKMRPAGLGALMQLLEERKKKLAAEGLFDAERKKPIPFLPGRDRRGDVSPTGAVIRDILHRVRDSFPCHVLIWPALVQGDGAAAEVEAGIRGFNALKAGRADTAAGRDHRGAGRRVDRGPVAVQRGARGAAQWRTREIPLISAVGHETDTTLIDFASDRRAPTPTGAAEMALPVRTELMQQVQTLGGRLTRRLTGTLERRKLERRSAGGRLPKLEALLQGPRQRLDMASQRFGGGAVEDGGAQAGAVRPGGRRAAAGGAAAGDCGQARRGGADGGAAAAGDGAASAAAGGCAARADAGAGQRVVRARAGAGVLAGDEGGWIAGAVRGGCGRWRCAAAEACRWRGWGDGGWRIRRSAATPPTGPKSAPAAEVQRPRIKAADDGRRSGQPVLRRCLMRHWLASLVLLAGACADAPSPPAGTDADTVAWWGITGNLSGDDMEGRDVGSAGYDRGGEVCRGALCCSRAEAGRRRGWLATDRADEGGARREADEEVRARK